MSIHRFGNLSWLGYNLPIAVPGPAWFDWLSDFTGLEAQPRELGSGPSILFVIDDRHVLVDEGNLTRFSGLDDLRAWLFLTVSDVMIFRGDFTSLHAAGFVVDGQAILVSGPPWAGKSSWSFEAQRRGLEVLGDDQVQVDSTTGLVTPLPRPQKRRLLVKEDEQYLSRRAVCAHVDGEYIALEPRRTGGLAPVDRGYPVGAIIHLARHNGRGVEVRSLRKFEAFQSILNQLRVYAPAALADAAASARVLGRLPNFQMSVGDGEIGRAMDMALDRSTFSPRVGLISLGPAVATLDEAPGSFR